jgi:uncharacterized UBP type Zn finger protein
MPVNELAHNVLIAMGLGENAAYRALIEVGGSSIDMALDWLMIHRYDNHIDDVIDKEYSTV